MKLKTLISNPLFWLNIIVIVIVIVKVALGWTNPSGTPPTGGGALSAEQNAPANSIYIKSSGNVGIGTAESKNKLDIEGGAVIGVSYSGTNTAPSNGLLVEGNVGIGTTGPDSKLHVIGSICAEASDTGCAPSIGYVRGTALCIGTDCKTNWSAGTVTQINAGTGITLSPNPITTTGSVSVDTSVIQNRVSGTCASNGAIRVINANGTVTCVTIPSSAICTWNGVTYSTGAIIYRDCGCNNISTYEIQYKCVSDGSWFINGYCSNYVSSCPLN